MKVSNRSFVTFPTKFLRFRFQKVPSAYIGISFLIGSSLTTAYAAGSSSDSSDNQIVLITAAISTAIAAVINAFANRQKAGKEMLESATATQTAVFDMLQKQTSSLQTQVEDLQKDRDFYREQNEKSSRQIESLIEENKELTAEIRAISRSYTVNRA